MINKKILIVTTLCLGMIFAQTFAQKEKEHEEKPTNLKILPKNISHDELIRIMKSFSMSLGVRCNFCHVAEKIEGQDKPRFDFASDNKPEKNIARDMMKMTFAINENYIGKMIGGDHTLEQISCVTCHMGRQTPVNSVDSLIKKQ